MLNFIKENAPALVDALRILVNGVNLWTILLLSAAHILMGWGLHALAKRRIIKYAWLAWFPIGNLWILGCLADQYRTVVKGQEKSNRRIRVFWIGLVALVLLVALIVLSAWGITYLAKNTPSMNLTKEQQQKMSTLTGDELTETYLELMTDMVAADKGLAKSVTTVLIIWVVLAILLLVATVDLGVEMYICLFDLYASCLPQHKVWFLVVSIVLGVEAIFVFICRKQHQGMPHDKKGRLELF